MATKKESAPSEKDLVKRGYRKRGKGEDSVMVSMSMPKRLKERVKVTADKDGRSQSEQMIVMIESGLTIRNAMKAVRAYLKKTPPPFTDEGWEPSQEECMVFILESIEKAIDHEI